MGYFDEISEAELITLMEQAFSSVDEVCSQLRPDEWNLPTDLPGWSVKDNLAHLLHYETILDGRPQPDHELDTTTMEHVRNDFAALNERGVDARRSRSGPDLLEEFRDVTASRSKTLSGWSQDDWNTEVPSPFGMMPARTFLPIRVSDVFYHEQDIRRATDRPGHLNGNVARFIFERFATMAMPRVIGKDAAAPEGTVVRIEAPAPGRTVSIAVERGRAVLIEEDRVPTVTFDFDSVEAFLLLVGGRSAPDALEASERMRASGDRALADAILAKSAVVP